MNQESTPEGGGMPPRNITLSKMVEMTAFEEFGLLGRESGHAHDYP
jgi:hypothetical protein